MRYSLSPSFVKLFVLAAVKEERFNSFGLHSAQLTDQSHKSAHAKVKQLKTNFKKEHFNHALQRCEKWFYCTRIAHLTGVDEHQRKVTPTLVDSLSEELQKDPLYEFIIYEGHLPAKLWRTMKNKFTPKKAWTYRTNGMGEASKEC